MKTTTLLRGLMVALAMVAMSACSMASVGPLDQVRTAMEIRDAAGTVQAVNQVRQTDLEMAGTYRLEAQFPDTTFVLYARTGLRAIAPIGVEAERSNTDRVLRRERIDWEAAFFTAAAMAWDEESLSEEMMEAPYPAFLWVTDTRDHTEGGVEYRGSFMVIPTAEGQAESDPFLQRYVRFFGEQLSEVVWSEGDGYGIRQSADGAVTVEIQGWDPDSDQIAVIRGERVSGAHLNAGSGEKIDMDVILQSMQHRGNPD